MSGIKSSRSGFVRNKERGRYGVVGSVTTPVAACPMNFFRFPVGAVGLSLPHTVHNGSGPIRPANRWAVAVFP